MSKKFLEVNKVQKSEPYSTPINPTEYKSTNTTLIKEISKKDYSQILLKTCPQYSGEMLPAIEWFSVYTDGSQAEKRKTSTGIYLSDFSY